MTVCHPRPARWLAPLLALLFLVGACTGTTPDDADATGVSAGSPTAAPTADSSPATPESPPPMESPGATESDGGQHDGPWSFTDDRGVTVTLDETPDVVLAYTDAGAALVRYGITPAGMYGATPIHEDPVFADHDISDVAALGSTYGEIDLEQMTALEPDLIVSTMFVAPDTDMSDAVLFGFNDLAQQSQVEAIAPLVGIDAGADAATALERVAELVTALGVDVESEFADDRTAFEDASEALRAAAADKSDLAVMVTSAFNDQFYVAEPGDYADLRYYLELGVPLVDPDSEEPFWQPLSYEQAGLYPADVIIHDDRPFATGMEQLQEVPTIASLPAVTEGQVAAWRGPAAPLTYGAYARNLQEHADLLAGAEKVTGN